jgi:hypothetical protein
MRRGWVLAVLLGLTGCASGRAAVAVHTVTVNVPVPVSCVPADMPPAPVNPASRETLLAAPDAAARYQLLARSWVLMRPRLELDEAVLAVCAKAGQ